MKVGICIRSSKLNQGEYLENTMAFGSMSDYVIVYMET